MAGALGCGVNVTNKDPTVCINDLVCRSGDLESAASRSFTVEEVVARSVTVLEQLVDKFESDDFEHVLDNYYKYWLHRHVIAKKYTCIYSERLGPF